MKHLLEILYFYICILNINSTHGGNVFGKDQGTGDSTQKSHFVDTAVANSILDKTALTKNHLAEMFGAKSALFKKLVQNCLVKEMTISQVNRGSSSAIYRIIVTFETKDKKGACENFTAIFKLMDDPQSLMKYTTNGNTQSDVANSTLDRWVRLHNAECDFFELFAQNQDIALDLPLPEIYYSQRMSRETPGSIIMEDFTDSSCGAAVFQSYSVQQVKEIVKHLAMFHGYILTSGNSAWKERIKEYRYDDVLAKGADQRIDQILLKFTDFKEQLNKLRSTVGTKFTLYAHNGCTKDLGIPELVVHGDISPTNVFWKKSDTGVCTNEVAAFIDWQIAFKGNPMIDIARMLVLSCMPDTRRQLETSIVKFYHDELKSATQRMGKTVEISLGNLEKAYKLAMVKCSTTAAVSAYYMEAKSPVSERAKIKNRAKEVIDDAVKILKDHPEWLSHI